MLQIEMMSMTPEGDADDVTHGDDVGTEESTADIQCVIINPQVNSVSFTKKMPVNV